ncbi:Initiator tRNA phosphoribosyl transferase [Moelleriella libera RCEF 2490]|uniref:Initiator tRNA phosphoribosyl transferase n=1 Tax=Moelleriella libera RCEF 2490 TaxID=1081109 RepID=A0A168E262_9HYPO|nr:Initiator tRNA phosphoribosyl transferase [Moelleriella libera RCEF 2490]
MDGARDASLNASPGMPDALSTTVPVWCAVVNAVTFPDRPLELFLPPHLLATTHAQVSALLPGFVSSLRALGLSSSALLLPPPDGVLTKPLRPYWITHDSAHLPAAGTVVFDDYRPVFCLTASRRDDGESPSSYVQGAGDDTENWARGLTPALFWANKDALLAAEERDLPDIIAGLVREHAATETAAAVTTDGTPALTAPSIINDGSSKVPLTNLISVCSLSLALPLITTTKDNHHTCAVIMLRSSVPATPRETWVRSRRHMDVHLGKHKQASRNLRLALPHICAFAAAFWSAASPCGEVVVACESGRDLSVGAALALSCYLFDEQGAFRPPPEEQQQQHQQQQHHQQQEQHQQEPAAPAAPAAPAVPAAPAAPVAPAAPAAPAPPAATAGDGAKVGERHFTKSLVKMKLAGIMTAFPHANPSRQTLQSVNSFLMDWTRA